MKCVFCCAPSVNLSYTAGPCGGQGDLGLRYGCSAGPPSLRTFDITGACGFIASVRVDRWVIPRLVNSLPWGLRMKIWAEA
jgi:hypothetical protein